MRTNEMASARRRAQARSARASPPRSTTSSGRSSSGTSSMLAWRRWAFPASAAARRAQGDPRTPRGHALHGHRRLGRRLLPGAGWGELRDSARHGTARSPASGARRPRVRRLRSRLRSTRRIWPTTASGKLHRITFDHPLGGPFSIPPAAGFADLAPNLTGLSRDGGYEVVNASGFSARADDAQAFKFGGGPVRRYVGVAGSPIPVFNDVIGFNVIAGGSSGIP